MLNGYRSRAEQGIGETFSCVRDYEEISNTSGLNIVNLERSQLIVSDKILPGLFKTPTGVGFCCVTVHVSIYMCV